MKDETLMAEEIGRLRTLNDTLKFENQNLRYAVYFDKAVAVFMIAPIVIVLSTLIGRAVFCSGDITHCYVDGRNDSSDFVGLYGNIDGWPDDRLGMFKTASDAAKEAQAIGCPMWRKR